MSKDKTVASVIIVIILTVMTKIFGFIREAIIGWTFGATMEMDTFILAQKITITIFISIGSAIGIALIPMITNKFNKDENENKKITLFISRVLSIATIFTLFGSAFLVLFSKQYTSLIARGFSVEKLNMTINYVKILLPTSVIIFAIYIFRAILQAKRRFISYTIMSIPYNIIIIGYLLILSNRFNILGLAIATIFGFVSQLIFVMYFVNKEKVKIKFSINFDDENLKMFLKLLIPILISTLIYTVNTLFDSGFASNLMDGRVAALDYGFKIYLSIATTIVLGITTVLYPKFIDVQQNSSKRLGKEVENILDNVLYIMIPILFGLVLVSYSFLKIVYLRGNFTVEDLRLTNMAFVFYTLGLIGYSIQELFNKVFFSIKNMKVPTICSFVCVVINIGLNSIFIHKLGMKGLALATSISITINAILLYIMIQVKGFKINNLKIFINTIKYLVASFVMFMVTTKIIDKYFKSTVDGSLMDSVLNIIYKMIIAIVIYVVLTLLFNVKQTKDIIFRRKTEI